MADLVFRLPNELHDKIRWLAFKAKRSQTSMMIYVLKQALEGVTVPEEARRGCAGVRWDPRSGGDFSDAPDTGNTEPEALAGRCANHGKSG